MHPFIAYITAYSIMITCSSFSYCQFILAFGICNSFFILIFSINISKYFLRVLLNHAPTSTQLHPSSPSSTYVHPPAPSSFQPPPSSLQHPQQYSNQSIARNWAIYPNLGRTLKNCSSWLKNGSHGILEVLIPKSGLDFWNSDPKINFWENLGPKGQSCLLCLKIGTHGISRMLILIPTLFFWISNTKIHSWTSLGSKSQNYLFCLKIRTHGISGILISTLVFWFSGRKSILGKFGPKESKLPVLLENWHTWYLEGGSSYSSICFLNFQL